jgi:DNA-directed RNA polymerase specialized sigma24 family protein
VPEKNARITEQILAGLPERDRQAMVRFYVRGEPADVVCRELGLTEEAFRLIKSRAKAAFRNLAPTKRKGT